MRNPTVRARLWGLGAALTLAVVAGAFLFADPSTSSPSSEQPAAGTATGDPGFGRGRRGARRRPLGRVFRPPGSHRARRPSLARGRRSAGRAFPRGRAGREGRPPDHHRPGALRGRGRAGRGAGGGGAGAPGARHERARPEPPAVGVARGAATRARRADQRAARGGGEPARRRGRAGGRAARTSDYTAVRAPVVRPRGQARGDRRQPGGGGSGGAGADDAGVGRSDLRELQRRRGSRGAGARVARARTRTRRSSASRCRWSTATSNGTTYRGPAAADRQPGRRAERNRVRARRLRQPRRHADARASSPGCAWAAPRPSRR